MTLATKCSLGDVGGGQKSRRVSCVLKGVKAKHSVSVGEIQFSRGVEGEVMAHDSVDLVTHRLDCNCEMLTAFYLLANEVVGIQGCHFKPA
jgi:hypothetical protein